jgi:hypothetical protein
MFLGMDAEYPAILPGMSDAVLSKGTLSAFLLRENEVPVSLPARQLGTVTVVGGADLVRAFDEGAPGTDLELVLGEALLGVSKKRGLGDEHPVSFLELLPGGSATIGTVTEGEFDRRAGVLFRGIDQIKCPGLIVAVAGEDVGGRNELGSHSDGDCRLVAVEAVALALAPVAFFRIVDGDNPVLGNALFDCRNTLFGALDILGQE